MTKKYKLYLSGPSKNLKDEGKGWRNEVDQYFLSYFNSVDVFNPTEHFDYSFRTPSTEKECRELFMHHLRKSDAILVNLDDTDTSPGTSYEIAVANELRIPIIGFGTKNIYGWVYDSCNAICKNWNEAVIYLMTHYFYYAK